MKTTTNLNIDKLILLEFILMQAINLFVLQPCTWIPLWQHKNMLFPSIFKKIAHLVWNFFGKGTGGLSCNTKFSYIHNSTHNAYIKSIDNIKFCLPPRYFGSRPHQNLSSLFNLMIHNVVLTMIPQELHWSNNVHLLPLFTKKKKMMPVCRHPQTISRGKNRLVTR